MRAEPSLQRLACVDDDPHLRLMLEYALGDVAGFSVRTYPTGEAALTDPAIHRAQVVLMDVYMPGTGGLETARCLREDVAGANVPIVFMTDRDGPDDLARYYAAGAAAVIPKPLDAFGLADELRAIWRQLHKSRALIDDKHRAILKFCETAQLQAESFPELRGVQGAALLAHYPRIYANAHRLGCTARTLQFEELGALLLRIEGLLRAVFDDEAPRDAALQLEVLIASVRHAAFGLTPQHSALWPRVPVIERRLRRAAP